MMNAISMPLPNGGMEQKKMKSKSGARRSPGGLGRGGGFTFFRRSSDKAELDVGDEDESMDTESALPLTDSDKMHRIIDLQEFDGSWHASTQLLELLGVSEDHFNGLMLGAVPEGGSVTHRATALAIAWLKSKVAAEEDVWEMVAEKALGWLAAQVGGDVHANEAIKSAGRLL
jgi:hypothetical protein